MWKSGELKSTLKSRFPQEEKSNYMFLLSKSYHRGVLILLKSAYCFINYSCKSIFSVSVAKKKEQFIDIQDNLQNEY